MTADTRKPFERAVTDIANRQPELCPQRHVVGSITFGPDRPPVSPAIHPGTPTVRRIVEFEGQLQKVTAERDQLAAALKFWLPDESLVDRRHAKEFYSACELLARINAQPQAPTRSRP